MTTEIRKIGIIQTFSLPGDFPNNLRSVVNAYRECLEHGAQLVIAPSTCICGIDPRDLAARRSFLEQTKDCLDALSRELGSVPLIVGAYTPMLDDEKLSVGMVNDDDESEPKAPSEKKAILCPYLIENNCVTELEDCGSFVLGSQRFYIDTTEMEILPPDDNDFLIRMSDEPWYATASDDFDLLHKWTASMGNITVICCRPVGTAGGNLYGGGSGVYAPDGRVLLRLPFFQAAAQVVNLDCPKPVLSPPDNVDVLCSAITRGIRDTIRGHCLDGVCIPLDHPNSALLGAFCIEAIGAAKVHGITFEGNEALANKLGISCHSLKLDKVQEAAVDAMGKEHAAALRERLVTALAMTHAESRGLFLCSPLSRTDIILGNFCMYGLSGAHLAPLGNLYSIDLYLCSCILSDSHPDLFGSLVPPADTTTDRIIHELMDRNIAASTLLNPDRNLLFKENEVRSIQRKILLSAIKRTQLPIVLNVTPKYERHSLPIVHRLND